jgi:hypothetical protein
LPYVGRHAGDAFVLTIERNERDLRVIHCRRSATAVVPPNFDPVPNVVGRDERGRSRTPVVFDFAYEVIDANDAVLYTVVGQDVTGTVVEVPGGTARSGTLELAESPRAVSRFRIFVPDIPGATRVKVYSAAMDRVFRGGQTATREIAILDIFPEGDR